MPQETPLDFRTIFEAVPASYLLLAPDPPRFTILGASAAYLRATHTVVQGEQSILGRAMFDVFPDPPDSQGATGTRNLRSSLERAMVTRRQDVMQLQHYDIRRPDGSWEERHWSPRNTPVLLPDGTLHCLIHEVEDVTHLVTAQAAARAAEEAVEKARAALQEAEAELGRERMIVRHTNARLEALKAESEQLHAEMTRLMRESGALRTVRDDFGARRSRPGT